MNSQSSAPSRADARRRWWLLAIPLAFLLLPASFGLIPLMYRIQSNGGAPYQSEQTTEFDGWRVQAVASLEPRRVAVVEIVFERLDGSEMGPPPWPLVRAVMGEHTMGAVQGQVRATGPLSFRASTYLTMAGRWTISVATGTNQMWLPVQVP